MARKSPSDSASARVDEPEDGARAAAAKALRTRYKLGEPGALQAIEVEAAKYRFYHSIELVPGLRTRGWETSDEFVERVGSVMESFDFSSMRVLDVGCRDGALSFKAELLGASEVIGIDNDLSPGLTQFLIPFRGSRVKAREMNANMLSRDELGEFDIVLFSGVLYHLRYPFWVLRKINEVLKPRGVLIIEGGFVDGFADLPILFCPIGPDSPYEASSVTFFNEAGLKDTLLSMGFSDVECHGSFLYTITEDQCVEFCRNRFPDFARRYASDLPFGICRKIVSCRKGWATRDGRITKTEVPGTQQEILQLYWDGVHGVHTSGSLLNDG
jgi:SAM-dependent methyltransferase